MKRSILGIGFVGVLGLYLVSTTARAADNDPRGQVVCEGVRTEVDGVITWDVVCYRVVGDVATPGPPVPIGPVGPPIGGPGGGGNPTTPPPENPPPPPCPPKQTKPSALASAEPCPKDEDKKNCARCKAERTWATHENNDRVRECIEGSVKPRALGLCLNGITIDGPTDSPAIKDSLVCHDFDPDKCDGSKTPAECAALGNLIKGVNGGVTTLCSLGSGVPQCVSDWTYGRPSTTSNGVGWNGGVEVALGGEKGGIKVGGGVSQAGNSSVSVQIDSLSAKMCSGILEEGHSIGMEYDKCAAAAPDSINGKCP